MKNDDLMQGIDEIDDKYVDEALNYKSKKSKKIIFAVAAAVLCIGVVCAYGVVRHNISNNSINNDVNNEANNNVNEVAKSDTIDVPKVYSGLIVIAKKSQKVEQDTRMKKGIEISFAEYGQWMSNLPAMPFSFDYINKNITDMSIRVSCGDNGVLQQWTVDNEGTWSKTFEGKSLTCMTSEEVYWQSANLEDSSGDTMTVEVLSGDKVVEKKHVKIWLNKDTWCFVGELMD